jgi:hypothetical protein
MDRVWRAREISASPKRKKIKKERGDAEGRILETER